MPKIIINGTVIFYLTATNRLVISNDNSFECCLIKLLPCILFEKYFNILALELASPQKRHCACCIGAFSFRRPIAVRVTRDLSFCSRDVMLARVLAMALMCPCLCHCLCLSLSVRLSVTSRCFSKRDERINPHFGMEAFFDQS